ncbi:MAG: hypothetical protein ACI85O_000304 [Saprospiraceae bacterium]|jgi:hypothetical protein
MKTPFLLFTLFFSCLGLYAQDACYQYSQNTQLGSTIEIWDWQQEQFEFHIPNLNSSLFDSPFFSTDFSGDPNTNYLAFQVEKDFDTEDGWELLYHNPGTIENKIDAPSFGLYNRYTGKIQIFVYYHGGEQPFQTASLRIKYDSGSQYQSGLLGLVEMPAEGIDNFTKKCCC